MNYLVLAASLSLFLGCSCQYQNGGSEGNHEDFNNYHRTPPPPQILSHKQALNHDGAFKYLFTSENGLAQGESIAPDGSRNGGYSYLDPNGKKISVKYTAGKEGFRIVEANHLPVAPLPVAPLPAPQQSDDQQQYQQPQPYQQPQYQQPQPYQRPQLYQRPQQYAQPQYNQFRRTEQEDDGQYRPHLYESQELQGRSSYPSPLTVSPTPSSNLLEEKDYNDEPGKANSFGSGYLFEFSG